MVLLVYVMCFARMHVYTCAHAYLRSTPLPSPHIHTPTHPHPHTQVLLAGPLMSKALRERLLDWGDDFKRNLQRDATRNPGKCDLMVCAMVVMVYDVCV